MNQSFYSGSSYPIPCPTGMYCPSTNQSEATHQCNAGFYCYQNATRGDPVDGATGWVCPAGFYCVSGTQAPEPCLPGTYNPTEQGTNISSCIPCDAGKYCSASQLTAPEGNCTEGYYCPGGDINTRSIPCDPGYQCPEGSLAPEPCSSGYYQDFNASRDCKLCPAGYVCNATLAPVSNPYQYECPQGYYCEDGTQFGEQSPCPKGKFNLSPHFSSQFSSFILDLYEYCMHNLGMPLDICVKQK